MPRVIGAGLSKELLFTGRMLTAEESLQVGLVNRIFPKETLVSDTKAWMRTFVEKSAAALKYAKICVDDGLQLSLQDGLVLESKVAGILVETPEARENVTTFLEKRKAKAAAKAVERRNRHDGFTAEGILVIDFGIHGAGSACGKTLADWGANVIKVEAPSGDASRTSGSQLNLPCTEDDNIHFELINGNKRSIVINMKTEDGRAIMERMLAKANIFFSNMRLGALERMGLDYESMSQRHPHIIWGHLSGYGINGPRAKEPGFDVVSYWASSGLLMDLTEDGYAPNTSPFGIGIWQLVRCWPEAWPHASISRQQPEKVKKS